MILNAGCILLINKNNNTFLSVSDKKRTDFNLPGGKIEENESIINGSIRELQEETGLFVNKNDLTEFYIDYCREHRATWKVTTFITFNYTGYINTKERGLVKWLPLSYLLCSKKYTLYHYQLYNKYFLEYEK